MGKRGEERGICVRSVEGERPPQGNEGMFSASLPRGVGYLRSKWADARDARSDRGSMGVFMVFVLDSEFVMMLKKRDGSQKTWKKDRGTTKEKSWC